MMLVLLLFTLSFENVLDKWHSDSVELDKLITNYLKSEPPYKEDYVLALMAMDILSKIDTFQKKEVSEAIYSNMKGVCSFSMDYPDELKLVSLRCYLNKGELGAADSIVNYIKNDYIHCMGLYFVGEFYINSNDVAKGKSYLKECVLNCTGTPSIWARDLLYGG